MNSSLPPIPYGRHSIDDDDIAAVTRVLRGDWLTQGPAVGEFEAALSNLLGADHAVVVNSGTAALHAGMFAMGIGPGDLVIVPAITFVASANAARYLGADVAFVDVEPNTGLIDCDALEQLLSDGKVRPVPKAVVAVHYAGLPCDMWRLSQICDRNGLELIEDACHAPGAAWTNADGRTSRIGDGSVSAFAALSFHPVKHVTTAEGGAVMTSRPELADRARTFRTHGITRDPLQLRKNDGPWWYEQHMLGYNYRLPDVLAALGTSQLRKHAGWLARRREIAATYRKLFADVDDIGLQVVPPNREHAYHLFPILVSERARVFDELLRVNIRVQVHYIPVHQQPYYMNHYGPVSLPVAESWYQREISLPMFPTMTDADVVRVVDAVSRAVRN